MEIICNIFSLDIMFHNSGFLCRQFSSFINRNLSVPSLVFLRCQREPSLFISFYFIFVYICFILFWYSLAMYDFLFNEVSILHFYLSILRHIVKMNNQHSETISLTTTITFLKLVLINSIVVNIY